jgi:hypothetical protein
MEAILECLRALIGRRNQKPLLLGVPRLVREGDLVYIRFRGVHS